MNLYISMVLVLVVFGPIIISVVILRYFRDSTKIQHGSLLISSLLTFLLLLSIIPEVMRVELITLSLFEILPNIALSFTVDFLSLGLALLTSFSWLIVSFYTLDYMANIRDNIYYYPINVVTLGSCLGIFLAGDFFTIFLFFQLIAVLTYLVLALQSEDAVKESGRNYLLLTIFSSIMLLIGIVIIYSLAGTASFLNVVQLQGFALLEFLSFLFFVIGFTSITILFPIFVWLPDAHPLAPSPISGLLSGIMLMVGAYGIMRVIFNLYGVALVNTTAWMFLLIVIGLLAIVGGFIKAMQKISLKGRLAYTFISQLGYIMMSIVFIAEEGFTIKVFPVFMYILLKLTVLLTIGTLMWRTGRNSLQELKSVGRQLPVIMLSFSAVAIFTIILPLTKAFPGGWLDNFQTEPAYSTLFLFVLLFTGLFNAYIYLPIIYMSFSKEKDSTTPISQGKVVLLTGKKKDGNIGFGPFNPEAPYMMLVPIMLIAGLSIFFSIVAIFFF